MGLRFWTRPRMSSFIQRAIMPAPPCLSVARSLGQRRAGAYLPDRTPWAIGDQTIGPTPNCSQVGMTSPSMTRHSIEYCGWLLIS